MGVAFDAPSVAESSRVGKVVEIVDRFFVLIWIGFYLSLPVSGWASIMFRSWFDQKRDLAALRSVIDVGHAEAIAQNGIGPAYIGVAALIHDVLRLGPEDSLILLTRASYALSAACGVVLVRVLMRRLTDAPPLVTLAAQFGFVGLVFAAGTWHWSDVPWSHFFAAFLAAAIYASRFVPPRLTLVSAAVTGSALALLWLTRSFEFAAVLGAWAVALVVLGALRLLGPRTLRVAHIVSGAAAFVFTAAVIYGVTGKRDLFLLYGSNLGSQSGNVRAAEVAQTPTFSPSLLPVKLVQLFVEPCYDTLCSLADYAGGARPLPPDLAGAAGNEKLWRLPLAVQLPSLVLLPLCLLAVAGIVVWAARRRERAPGRLRAVRLLVELTVASTGLVLGYAANTMTGSPHLRYGFARDFLLAALLTGVVAVALTCAGLWLLLSRGGRARRVSPEFAFVMLTLVGSALLVAVFAHARADGIPRIESHQLGSVVYSASCRSGSCDVTMSATTTSGRSISIPVASTLTFGCGSDVARFTLYSTDPSRGVQLERSCPDARLVAAWPTVMGLPPGTYELGAVKVVNRA